MITNEAKRIQRATEILQIKLHPEVITFANEYVKTHKLGKTISSATTWMKKMLGAWAGQLPNPTAETVKNLREWQGWT